MFSGFQSSTSITRLVLGAPPRSRKHCAILALPFLFPTVRDGKHIAVEAVAELLCHSSWPVRWAAAATLIQLDPGKLPSFGSCQSSQNMRSHQPLSPVPPFRVAIQNAVKLQAQGDQRFVRDVAKHLSSMDLTGQKCQTLCSQALLVASKLQEKKRGRDSEQSRNARSSSQARHKRDKFQKLAPSSLVLDLTS
ncbi:unnamed protein product [Cladocopium goreaui]|uniref:Uncharacterized protein n=1 Tax=Cladocopium goreaui TaxID=2562237 RepID=A0A9P1DQ47_9DINO|nr:unnamed protein product [Cladocopium goreaui]